MLRPRIVVILALLALAGWVAFQVFGGGSPGAPGAGEGPAQVQQPIDTRNAPVGAGAPAVAPVGPGGAPDAAGRTEVAPETALRGAFRAPTGSWPGGGVAVLVPRAEAPEGGMMGLFSAGMEFAREGESARADPAKRREFEQRMAAWFGRADPLATTGVDPRGRFEFRDPPEGAWAIELRHDSLRPKTPAPADVVRGERRDVGEIDTELAASALVVVSDAGGTPLPAAKVRVGRQVDPSKFTDPSALRDMGSLIRGLIPFEGRTDDNGRCALQGLDDDVRWNLAVEKDGYVADYQDLRLSPGRQTIVRVELEQGAALEVTVRDAAGAPFAGARVRLQYPDLLRPSVASMQVRVGAGGQGGVGQEPVNFGIETGADGVARRAGLPPGRAELRLVTPGFRRELVELTVPEKGLAEHAFVLDRGATVSGRVVDEAGTPIEGAYVLNMAGLGGSVMGMDLQSIVGLDVLTVGAEERGVRTDAEGKFVFGGFEPDGAEVHLAAAATGFDPVSADAKVGDRDVEFRLLKACSVRGRVVDDRTGEAVTAFRVSLQQRQFLVVDRAVVRREFEGRTDGSFEVSPAPRQGFELVVDADGYASSSTSIDLSKGSLDAGTIRLALPSAVAGTTVGPDGAPVAGAKVRVSKGGPADSLFLAELLGQQFVLSDAQGRFRLDGLTGRAVRLLADADGYAPLRTKAIRIEPGETVDGVVLELTRGGSIRGSVVDGEHRPLVGWNVQAEHASGAGHAFAKSDAAGAFQFEGLAGGTYKVTGLPPDYMERNQWRPTDPSEFGDLDIGKLISQATEMSVVERVVVREGEVAEVTLVHEGAAESPGETLVTVTGDVRVGGAPLAGGMVALTPSGATVPRHFADVAAGRFRIERVRPGTYRLQARAGLLAGDLGDASVVVIPSQPTHEVHVDLPGGAIAGRVTDADTGEPIPAALLMLSSPGGGGGGERMDVGEGAALSDGDGRFRFDGLGEGSYEVFAKQWSLGGSGGRSGRLSVLVGPGEVRDGLELALTRGGTLRVTVRDAGGGPRANALVALIGAHGDPLDLFHRALTDRDGLAEFSGVPDGAYRASVDAPNAAPVVSAPVELRGGAASIDVAVRPGVSVTLKLVGEVPESWRGEVLTYAVWRGDGALLRSGRVVVPGPGALEASARRGLSVGSYAPGTYRLRVEGARLGVLDETRAVPAGDAAEWAVDVASIRRR